MTVNCRQQQKAQGRRKATSSCQHLQIVPHQRKKGFVLSFLCLFCFLDVNYIYITCRRLDFGPLPTLKREAKGS